MATTAEPTTTSEHAHVRRRQKDGARTLLTSRFARWSSSAARSADDVAITITYAGICHSDLHTAPQRLGRDVLPLIPGHEIVGTRHRGRRRSDPSSSRRHRRGRLHGRQLHGVRPVPGGLGGVLPQGLRPDLQQQGLSRRRPSPRAVIPTTSSSATISRCKVPEGMDVSRGRASAVRRNHHLLAASPVERRAGHEGRRSSASAALATWA